MSPITPHLKPNDEIVQNGNSIPGNSSFISLEEEPRPDSDSRKFTPARTVFTDFREAHSSITSGSARSRSNSQHQSTNGDCHLIQLQCLTKSSAPSTVHDLPLPPVPAILPKSPLRQLSKHSPYKPHKETPAKENQLVLPQNSSTSQHSPSILANIRNALVRRSQSMDTPLTKKKRGSRNRWPRDSLELRRELLRVAGSEQTVAHSAEDSKSLQRSDDCPHIDPGHTKSRHVSSIYHSSLGEAPSGSVAPSSQYGDDTESQKSDENDDLGFSDPDVGVDTSERPHSFQFASRNPFCHSWLYNDKYNSTQEGSTITKIIDHYATSNNMVDVELGSDQESNYDLPKKTITTKSSTKRLELQLFDAPPSSSSWLATETARSYRPPRLAQHSGMPPEASPPVLPARTFEEFTNGTTTLGTFAHSSSYGDTRNLLNVTGQLTWTSSDRAIPLPSQPLGTGEEGRLLGVTTAARAPPTVQTDQTSNTEDLDGQERNGKPFFSRRSALERDISRSLRRHSAYSNHSLELSSSATDLADPGIPPKNPARYAPMNQAVCNHQRGRHEGFYDSSALNNGVLPSKSSQDVRISITEPHTPPPQVYSDNQKIDLEPQDIMTISGRDDDTTDWETVGDSIAASRYNNMMFGGSLRQAASTFADYSTQLFEDYSQHPYEGFCRSERMVHHPGQIGLSHEYRERELKDNGMPVLLPQYRTGPNGFPANSSRAGINPFKTPTREDFPSTSLLHGHNNPFRSPPPEQLPVRSPGSSVLVNGYNPFTSDLESATTLSSQANRNIEVLTGLADSQNSEQSYNNWMDEFSEPGPPIRLDQFMQPVGDATHDQHCQAEQNTKVVVSRQTASPAISDFQSDNCGHKGRQLLRKTVPPGAAKSLFGKSAPGALYTGICSRKDRSRRDVNERSTHRPTQISERPTDKDRQASVLSGQSVEIPLGQTSTAEDHDPNALFVYRSPLARVKKDSWQFLYAETQLGAINERGNSTYVSPQSSQSFASSENLKHRSERLTYTSDASMRQLMEVPHLFAWPRDNSDAPTDIIRRQWRWSILTLALCSLFPPLLILFYVGKLDPVIQWVTDDEIRHFCTSHKRSALYICYGLMFATAATIVVLFSTKRIIV